MKKREIKRVDANCSIYVTNNWTLPISVNISIFIHCTKHNLYGYKYVRDYLCSSSFDPSDSTVIGECSVR